MLDTKGLANILQVNQLVARPHVSSLHLKLLAKLHHQLEVSRSPIVISQVRAKNIVASNLMLMTRYRNCRSS